MTRRLLLDQNLSRRLISILNQEFAGPIHVSTIGLTAASDRAVWTYAREHGMAIVSKDSDFHHLGFLDRSPPKTIWIRVGNCSTAMIAECLLGNANAIHLFLSDPTHSILTIDERPVFWPAGTR